MRSTIVTMRNPRTGELIEPIMFRANGTPVFPIMGGAPDADDDGGADDTEDEDSDSDEDQESDDADTEDEGPVDLKRVKEDLSKRNSENRALRKRLKDAEDAAAKWAEHQKSQMSKEERLAAEAAEKGTAASNMALENARLKVQLATGLTERQVARLVGSDFDELLADAEAFKAEAGITPKDDKKDEPPARRTPAGNKLKGGLNPSDDEDPDGDDPAKLAAAVPRGY